MLSCLPHYSTECSILKMVKLLTIISFFFSCFVCLFRTLAHEKGGGGIIDVCNDADIFEKILAKAFVFEEEWDTCEDLWGSQYAQLVSK